MREAITDAKQSLRAATVGRETLASNIGETMTETRTTIIETVRANPIPAALIGAGLAWMFINRTKSVQMKSLRYEDNFAGDLDDGRGYVEAQVSKFAHQAVDAAGNVIRSAGDQINNAAHDVAHATGRLGTTMQTRATDLARSAGELGSRIVTQAGEVYDSSSTVAKRGVSQVSETYNATLQENPLLIAGAAIAFGVLIGFSFPRTRREDELMGAQRDRLIQRAGHKVTEGAAALADNLQNAMDKGAGESEEPTQR